MSRPNDKPANWRNNVGPVPPAVGDESIAIGRWEPALLDETEPQQNRNRVLEKRASVCVFKQGQITFFYWMGMYGWPSDPRPNGILPSRGNRYRP